MSHCHQPGNSIVIINAIIVVPRVWPLGKLYVVVTLAKSAGRDRLIWCFTKIPKASTVPKQANTKIARGHRPMKRRTPAKQKSQKTIVFGSKTTATTCHHQLLCWRIKRCWSRVSDSLNHCERLTSQHKLAKMITATSSCVPHQKLNLGWIMATTFVNNFSSVPNNLGKEY